MTLVKIDNEVFDALHKKSIASNMPIKHTDEDEKEFLASGKKIDGDKTLIFTESTTGNQEHYISRNGGGWEEFK